MFDNILFIVILRFIFRVLNLVKVKWIWFNFLINKKIIFLYYIFLGKIIDLIVYNIFSVILWIFLENVL